VGAAEAVTEGGTFERAEVEVIMARGLNYAWVMHTPRGRQSFSVGPSWRQEPREVV